MQDTTLKVIKLLQVNGANAQGQAEQQIQVTYTIGQHGPFTRNYPAQGFNAAAVQSDIAAFQAQVAQLAGV